jgi:putative transposase
MDRYRVSERRGCAAMRFDRSSHRYRGHRSEQAPLRHRIKEIAAVRPRYGYRRIHVLLRREGWAINHKRVLRLYREEGLNLRARRPRRHVSAARRLERLAIGEPNEVWAMDFVSDALFNGKRLRALTVVDAFTRECLAIQVARASGVRTWWPSWSDFSSSAGPCPGRSGSTTDRSSFPRRSITGPIGPE